MKTKAEILKALAAGKPALQARFKVKNMALFGSVARGDETANSDVDILVDVDPSIGLDFVTLAERIEQVLGLRVDLVSTRAVKPAYRAVIEPDLIYVQANTRTPDAGYPRCGGPNPTVLRRLGRRRIQS